MVQYSCFCININGQASLYVICIYNNLEQFENICSTADHYLQQGDKRREVPQTTLLNH